MSHVLFRSLDTRTSRQLTVSIYASRGTVRTPGQHLWMPLHVTHACGDEADRRTNPFPFATAELTTELTLLNAAHIYYSNRDNSGGDLLTLLVSPLSFRLEVLFSEGYL